MNVDGATLLLASVLAPAVFGLLATLMPGSSPNRRTVVMLLGMLLAFVGVVVVFRGQAESGAAVVGFPFAPSLNLNLSFNPDSLGTFFALLISGIGAAIVVYARGYFGENDASLRRFYPTLGFFATAMLGVVLSDNILAMVVFWELTSVSSFLLIGWNRDDRNSVRLAIQALVTTGVGGLALLGGVLLLGGILDEWSLRRIIALLALGELTPHQLTILPWAFVLLFVGGATKSAQWPFHYWLPGAMAAPTPVSAYLHAATMVKAGIYLFGRFAPALAALEAWPLTLIPVGAITMLLGAFLALRSDELKKIFAYTTVSQLGLFTCMYGLSAFSYDGESNLIWPVTQILNHALYKAPLFMFAGAVAILLKKTRLSELNGLLRTSPLLAWVCLIAAFAMAGLPPTLSFVAKEAFFYQIAHATESADWVWAIATMAILTSACNVAIFVRILATFLRPSDEGQTEKATALGLWSAGIWWPAAIMALLQIVGGVIPASLEMVVRPLETNTHYWDHLPGVIHAFTHPSMALAMTGGAVVVGVLLGLSPLLRTVARDPHDRLFGMSVHAADSAGGAILRILQTGNFRWYVYMTLTALLMGIGATALFDERFARLPTLVMFDGLDRGLVESVVLIAFLICASSLALPIVRSRIVRVLVLGGAGFAVTSMYLLYRAPDLALTQIMFEIISVVLFLLVLRMLPEEPQSRPRRGWIGRAVFASVCGLAMGWIVLQVGGFADLDPGNGKLGDWFLAHSVHGLDDTFGRGAEGKNVVNTILVDFRGYDTLGEIIVLAIASIGVFVLIGRAKGDPHGSGDVEAVESQEAATVDPRGVVLAPQPTLTSSLFSTTMKLILPLSLIFAGYVFFKGHNEPGGGFIAGLVAAVAIAVYRMAEGPGALHTLLPIKPGPMAAIGIAIALTTATAPLLLGYPFLRSHTAHILLPGGGDFHWASVMLFDLGVMLVVVAVSVGIINRLTEELE